jgi:hypothetical protein
MHHAIWLPLDQLIADHLGSLTLADAVARGASLDRELLALTH